MNWQHVSNERTKGEIKHAKKTSIFAFAKSLVFILPSKAQTADSGFPKGELSSAKNHTGNSWLSELNVGDSLHKIDFVGSMVA